MIELKYDKTVVETFEDPFTAKGFKNINIHIGEMPISKRVAFRAYIKFENGNTSGTHKIKGNDFNDLMYKIKLFLDGLKQKE